jgi:fido (protein-threonine AMPylation protein)
MPSSHDYTHNAIPTLLSSLAAGSSRREKIQLTVHMRPVASDNLSRNPIARKVVLYDGTHQVGAAALSWDKSSSFIGPSIVHIYGYVVSEANHTSDVPILVITSYDIAKANVHLSKSILSDKQRYHQSKSTIRGGVISYVLNHCVPLISEKHLSGSNEDCLFPTTRRDVVWHCKFDEKYNKVTDFFAQHMAMKTLHNSLGANSASNTARTECYMSALLEFQQAQMDLQNASLTTNCGKETAARASQIAEQYREALTLAFTESDQFASTLTVETLCEWHKILCGNGLSPPGSEAGALRCKNVRTGSTSYCNHESVALNLNLVCTSLHELEMRFVESNASSRNPTLAGTFKLEQSLIYASAVLMGVADVHPFADGNGRLARIALNWALRRVGLPFVVHLFATEVQRKEYIRSLQLTLRNICLQKRGNADDEELLQSYQIAGALSPLFELILDRVWKAVVEFERLVEEKATLDSEAIEDKAARKHRERAASGNCMICYDEKPNIATLCCGKPIHLNCMAEWLSNKNSCPQCRTELPTLPERMQRMSRDIDQEEDATTDSDGSFFPSWNIVSINNDQTHSDNSTSNDETMENNDADETTSINSAESTDETAEAAEYNGPPAAQANSNEDTTMYDDNDAQATTDTTYEAVAALANAARQPICFRDGCYNIAAKECQNQACGRCCLLHGQFNCSRHNC